MRTSAKIVKIKGIRNLRKKLTKLGKTGNRQAREAAVKAGLLVIQNQAKQNVDKQTGTLARSISSEVKSQGERTEGRTGTNLEYARMEEFGTAGLPGGVLRPKNAEYLVFEVGGQVVQTKEVRRDPHPYLRPAFDQKKNEAVLEIRRALKKIIQKAV